MKKKVVVALGHRALGTTLPEQKVAVKKTAVSIADLVEEGYQVVITHSNGPQVGMIHTAMNEFSTNHPDYTASPMSVCSAMSQGYIGYDLQNAIREELIGRGIYRSVCTVITQVTVDPYDEAFYTPTKIVGRIMNAEDAAAERKKGNYVVEVPGQGFRRVVASPNPVDIVEVDAIRTLTDAGHIVIACGGGGIPVLQQNNHLKGASGVIEKDLTAGKLAEQIDADELIILTSVEKVCLNHGKEDEEELWNFIQDAVKEACEGFVKTRITEGENLKNDLLHKLDHMEELVGFIEERSPQIVSEYRKKLETKMAEVLADTSIDENRIAAEVILYADKICVDEETVRLRSHIAHARQCLSEDGGIGRKLDFIAQEMNREANTTLSKANDIEISNAAIDLKTEIEKVREQIQNIE